MRQAFRSCVPKSNLYRETRNENQNYNHRFTLIALLTTLPSLAADNATPPPYLGQEPPGFVPKLFAPGVAGGIKRALCLTQDGRECYFNAPGTAPRSSQIMVTRYEKGAWTPPVQAPFSDETSYGPALSDNDRTLYFIRSKFTTGGLAGPMPASRPGPSPWPCPRPSTLLLSGQQRQLQDFQPRQHVDLFLAVRVVSGNATSGNCAARTNSSRSPRLRRS